MKILYIISNTRIGGAECHLLRIGQQLKKVKPEWQVDCLVTHEKGVQQECYENTFDNLFFKQEINPRDYDLVHGINNFVYMGEYMSQGGTFCSCVWMDLPSHFNECYVKILNDDTNYCAFFTEHKSNLAMIPKPAKPPGIVRQIHNGIDVDFWTMEGEKKEQVCWVGHMISRKDVEILPPLIARYPEINFIVVAPEARSDGPYTTFAILQEMAKNHKNLDLRWNLTHKELREVYRESKIYLMTAISEGQPGAMLEAMACGCVPIVSDLPPLYEILNPGYICGYTVQLHEDRERRIAAFAYYIKTYGFTGDSEKARRRITESFTLAQSVNQYIQAYEEIIAGR